jgi:hypothetical protein
MLEVQEMMTGATRLRLPWLSSVRAKRGYT